MPYDANDITNHIPQQNDKISNIAYYVDIYIRNASFNWYVPITQQVIEQNCIKLLIRMINILTIESKMVIYPSNVDLNIKVPFYDQILIKMGDIAISYLKVDWIINFWCKIWYKKTFSVTAKAYCSLDNF